jgi:hypothetical protein
VLSVLGKEDVQKGILRERINIRRSEIKQGEKRKAKGKTTKKKDGNEKVKEGGTSYVRPKCYIEVSQSGVYEEYLFRV